LINQLRPFPIYYMQWLRRITMPLVNAIWPPNCPICQRATSEILCSHCQRQINACRDPQFFQPDAPISPEIPLFSWGIYDGPLKRAIATCKYDGNPNIAKFLGQAIGETWRTHPSTPTDRDKTKIKPWVISIPLHPKKLKSRGFNQAAILADGFAEITGLKHQPQLLERIKNTKAQMQTTSKAERIANLAGAFTVNQALAQRLHHQTKSPHSPTVILLDDIYTTGATITEAIKALAQSNIAVGAVTVLSRPVVTKPKTRLKP
jgi:ComF family protein